VLTSIFFHFCAVLSFSDHCGGGYTRLAF